MTVRDDALVVRVQVGSTPKKRKIAAVAAVAAVAEADSSKVAAVAESSDSNNALSSASMQTTTVSTARAMYELLWDLGRDTRGLVVGIEQA